MPEYNDLESAVEFVSTDGGGANFAVYDRETDKLFYQSPYADFDDFPEDVEDARYVRIPTKKDLDLGRDLVFRFARQAMPDDEDLVYSFFQHRGAYGSFKDLLAHRNMVDQWHQFEDKATRQAIEQWCNENGIKITG